MRAKPAESGPRTGRQGSPRLRDLPRESTHPSEIRGDVHGSDDRLHLPGEWKDGEALFLRCRLWRQAAENAAESLDRKSVV